MSIIYILWAFGNVLSATCFVGKGNYQSSPLKLDVGSSSRKRLSNYQLVSTSTLCTAEYVNQTAVDTAAEISAFSQPDITTSTETKNAPNEASEQTLPMAVVEQIVRKPSRYPTAGWLVERMQSYVKETNTKLHPANIDKIIGMYSFRHRGYNQGLEAERAWEYMRDEIADFGSYEYEGLALLHVVRAFGPRSIEMIRVLTKAHEQFNITLEAKHFAMGMTTLVQADRSDLVHYLYDEMINKYGIGPDRYVCNALLKTLIGMERVDDAVLFLDQMRAGTALLEDRQAVGSDSDQSACPDEFLTSSLSFSSSSSSSTLIDDYSYCILIDGFAKLGRIDKVEAIFEKMIEDGKRSMLASSPPSSASSSVSSSVYPMRTSVTNIVAINSMLKAYFTANRVYDALALFNSIGAQFNIEPDKVTYSTLIDGLGKTGDVKSAMEVFQQLLDHRQMKIDEMEAASGSGSGGGQKEKGKGRGRGKGGATTTTTTTTGSRAKRSSHKGKNNQGKEAEGQGHGHGHGHGLDLGLADEFNRGAALALDTPIFGSLIQSHLRFGYVKEALDLFHRMDSEYKVRPNGYIYSILLDGLGKNGQIEAGYQLFIDAVERGEAKIEHYTANAIIRGFCMVGKAEIALQFFNDLKSEYEYDPEQMTYSTLAYGLSSNNMVEEAMATIADMVDRDIPRNHHEMDRLVKALVRARRVDDAREVVHTMVALHGIEPAGEQYSLVLHAYIKEAYRRNEMEGKDKNNNNNNKNANSSNNAKQSSSSSKGLEESSRSIAATNSGAESERSGRGDRSGAISRHDRQQHHQQQQYYEYRMEVKHSPNIDFSAAEEYLAELRQEGLASVYMYRLLLRAYCKHGHLQKALTLFNQMALDPDITGATTTTATTTTATTTTSTSSASSTTSSGTSSNRGMNGCRRLNERRLQEGRCSTAYSRPGSAFGSASGSGSGFVRNRFSFYRPRLEISSMLVQCALAVTSPVKALHLFHSLHASSLAPVDGDIANEIIEAVVHAALTEEHKAIEKMLIGVGVDVGSASNSNSNSDSITSSGGGSGNSDSISLVDLVLTFFMDLERVYHIKVTPHTEDIIRRLATASEERCVYSEEQIERLIAARQKKSKYSQPKPQPKGQALTQTRPWYRETKVKVIENRGSKVKRK